MHDRELREALHHKLLKEHHGDTNTLVLDELGLRHGTCRVDIAVVNGYLHGYEIKSDADTLQRLPGQVSLYCAVLDRATLVVGEKHAEKAKAHLPDWWGVEVASTPPKRRSTPPDHWAFVRRSTPPAPWCWRGSWR